MNLAVLRRKLQTWPQRVTCARCETVSPIPDDVGTDDPRKPSVAAGLLQLLFGFLGLGRFYLGYIGIGVAQLGLWIASLLVWLFINMVLGWIMLAASGVWVLVEAIMMIVGAIPDSDGRRLA
ncbi:NINE protein [Mycobacterium sp. 20091114027_K0903767]|nr:NINE protein [Mycobacterium sp. 20091114027_K0903767]